MVINLSHDNELNEEEWKEYYQNYFTSSRCEKFRYCLLVHLETDPTIRGRAHIGGDHLVLFYENIGWDSFWGEGTLADRETQVFMHELGHNILGELDPTHYISSSDKAHCKNDCAMQFLWSTKVHYCSDCLNEIRRDGLHFEYD